MIQLLTPSSEHTDEHNAWLRALPQTIRQLVFTVKRYYLPEWGGEWRKHFSVDRVNGFWGHELKFDNQKLVSNYLRVGFDAGRLLAHLQIAARFLSRGQSAGGRRHHGFGGAAAREPERFGSRNMPNPSVKLVKNCETASLPAARRRDSSRRRPASRGRYRQPGHVSLELRAVQRRAGGADRGPRGGVRQVHRADEASARGISSTRRPTSLRRLVGASARGGRQAVQESALSAEAAGSGESARDAIWPKSRRGWSAKFPRSGRCIFPVNAVLAGRRNNPPDPEIGLPPLAVYNPIHYQELPELFMEFISSLTGKSPSTTGFGSEGALTKGAVQRAVAGGGFEQRAGLLDSDAVCGLHDFGGLRGAAACAWITTSACWCRKSGAGCACTSAIRIS